MRPSACGSALRRRSAWPPPSAMGFTIGLAVRTGHGVDRRGRRLPDVDLADRRAPGRARHPSACDEVHGTTTRRRGCLERDRCCWPAWRAWPEWATCWSRDRSDGVTSGRRSSGRSAWWRRGSTVHTVYMLRYARLFYGGDEPGGIDFHEGDGYQPDLWRLRVPGLHARHDVSGLRHRSGRPAGARSAALRTRCCRSCSARSSWRITINLVARPARRRQLDHRVRR